jgi:RsfA family transcription factor
MKPSLKGWTASDEELLIEKVDSFVGKGLSKKAAFQEAAERMNRTTAACSHHYYALRKKKAPTANASPLTLHDCINFLSNLQQPDPMHENEILKKEKEELLHSQEKLKGRHESLLKKQKKLQQLLSILKEAEHYGDNPVIH